MPRGYYWLLCRRRHENDSKETEIHTKMSKRLIRIRITSLTTIYSTQTYDVVRLPGDGHRSEESVQMRFDQAGTSLREFRVSSLGQIVRQLGIHDLGSEHCKTTELSVDELLSLSTWGNWGVKDSVYLWDTDLVVEFVLIRKFILGEEFIIADLCKPFFIWEIQTFNFSYLLKFRPLACSGWAYA